MPTAAPSISPGLGNMPQLQLTAANGASATIYLQGAHVSSWQVPGVGEQLFMSRAAQFAPGKALRGGVPVIFPQFGAFGPGGKHGFARVCDWQFNEQASRSDSALFTLTANTRTLSAWPFLFAAEYQVTLGDNSLHMQLCITNTDDKPFVFTSALHTYFALQDLQHSQVQGLNNLTYWDNGTDFQQRHTQTHGELNVCDALDRVYFQAPAQLILQQPHQQVTIRSEGFQDCVIWNPGQSAAAALPDMLEEEFLKMLCIESAVVDNPVSLSPGEKWVGVQQLILQVK